MAKSFKSTDNPAFNPALQYLEGTTKKASSRGRKKKPKLYISEHIEGDEVKSRRLQLILKPSLVDIARDYADKHQMSLNHLVSIALEAYISKGE